LRLSILTLFVAVASVGSLRADLIIDQQYTARPNLGTNQSVSFFQPFGQSFTPSLASLNIVQLHLSEAVPGPDLDGGTFAVRIREGGNATGAVLGTSTAEMLPYGFGTSADDFGYGFPFGGSLVQFDFATPMALDPGALYSIELVDLSQAQFLVYGTQPGGYPGGTAITGFPFPPVDFFFREGINTVPEPGTLGLFGILLFGLAVLHRCSERASSTDLVA
jgi:hypothetical protein